MIKDTVVFDLDGTLACGKHRLHLLPAYEDRGNTQAWDAFNLACSVDDLITDNRELLVCLEPTYQIVILSGRCDVAWQETIDWLAKWDVRYDRLIMRPANDHRKDVEFKEEALREIGLDRILCCFDDLEHVCKHIRSLGVTCHQVVHYDEPHLHTSDHREPQKH